MAKQPALGIVTDGGADKLAESYGRVIENVQASALSNQQKNAEYSGDPSTGSVEIKRFTNSESKALGTARTANAGVDVKNVPVTVNLNVDREIVEELKQKDIDLYGVPDLVARREKAHQNSMVRELDRAFFAEAESAGSETVLDEGLTIVEKVEALIQSVETISNDYVDGIDRENLSLDLIPAAYGALENYIDTLPNANGVDIKTFHNVRIFSNTRQTKDAICMANGSIGQPVSVTPYVSEKIPFFNGVAVQLYYSYGTKAITPDLIKWATIVSTEVSA